MNCPLCTHSAIPVFDLYDDRYGYPGTFSLYRCTVCAHGFLDAKQCPTDLVSLYTIYYPRSGRDVTSYEPSKEPKGFSAWLNGARCSAYTWVPEKVRVLDIGCGFGEALGYHQSRGCEVYGVETDENLRRVAEKYGFNVHIGEFRQGVFENGYFDYVTLDQVLEHSVDPFEMLSGINAVLKSGGSLVMSTPNSAGIGASLFGRKWINWHVPYHRHFFTPESLRALADRSGYDVLSCRTITSSEWLYYQWVHLVTFPRAGERSSFWSEGIKKPAGQKSLTRLATKFHKLKLNHLLTRSLDLLGRGDSMIAVLGKR